MPRSLLESFLKIPDAVLCFSLRILSGLNCCVFCTINSIFSVVGCSVCSSTCIIFVILRCPLNTLFDFMLPWKSQLYVLRFIYSYMLFTNMLRYVLCDTKWSVGKRFTPKLWICTFQESLGNKGGWRTSRQKPTILKKCVLPLPFYNLPCVWVPGRTDQCLSADCRSFQDLLLSVVIIKHVVQDERSEEQAFRGLSLYMFLIAFFPAGFQDWTDVIVHLQQFWTSMIACSIVKWDQQCPNFSVFFLVYPNTKGQRKGRKQ